MEATIYYVLYVCLFYTLGNQVLRLVWVYWFCRPDSDIIVGLPTIFGKWLTSIFCLLQGPEIMIEAHRKAAGKPFAIPTLTNYNICVSDAKHVTELTNAPSHQLSFRKFLQGTLYPQHTRTASVDGSSREYSISVSTLMVGLRSNLPALRERLQQRLSVAFEREICGPKDCNGWIRMPASAASYRIAGSLNSSVVLGEKLSSDPDLPQATLQFAHDAAITTQLMRFTPSILQTPVSFVSMHWSGACKTLEERVSCEIQERLSSYNRDENTNIQHLDCIQWTIDAYRSSKAMSVTGTLQRVMGFLFASHHQVTPLVASSLFTLCQHPEYLQPLQEEVSRIAADEMLGTHKEDTPLLDSFIKETARLHPLQIVSMNRKVMAPFVFSDGTYVPAGNTVCVPQQAVMQDPKVYNNPLEFQGFRFVTQRDGVNTSTSRLSHPSQHFPFWGAVGRACPARFYVSMVVKMVLVHVIKHYEIKLANEDAKPHFSWGVDIITHPRLTFLIRKRKVESV